MFTPLQKEQVERIMDLMLERLRKRLADKQLSLSLTDAAKERLIAQGYDPVYGARPMKRLLQSKVETLAARLLVSGQVLPGQEIVIDADVQDGYTASVKA